MRYERQGKARGNRVREIEPRHQPHAARVTERARGGDGVAAREHGERLFTQASDR